MKHSSKAAFVANVEKRLKFLSTKKYAVTRYSSSTHGRPPGGRPNWLGDFLNPKRNPKGISLDILDEIGVVLGVFPASDLCHPQCDVKAYEVPQWVLRMREQAELDEGA